MHAEDPAAAHPQGPNMIKGEYPTAFPLKHQHKDLRLALELADTGTLAELPLAKLTEAIYRQGAVLLQRVNFLCCCQLCASGSSVVRSLTRHSRQSAALVESALVRQVLKRASGIWTSAL